MAEVLSVEDIWIERYESRGRDADDLRNLYLCILAGGRTMAFSAYSDIAAGDIDLNDVAANPNSYRLLYRQDKDELVIYRPNNQETNHA